MLVSRRMLAAAVKRELPSPDPLSNILYRVLSFNLHFGP
jgi:hypothetical protein